MKTKVRMWWGVETLSKGGGCQHAWRNKELLLRSKIVMMDDTPIRWHDAMKILVTGGFSTWFEFNIDKYGRTLLYTF